MSSFKKALITLSASCATLVSASALSMPMHLISPAVTGSVDCTNTQQFASADACIGAVTDPNNDVGSFPNLIDYLNGVIGDYDGDGTNEAGYVGTVDGLTPWGDQGDWVGISNQIDPPPGTSGDGFLTTMGSGTSGTFKFDVTSTGKTLKYFVVSVKGGPNWSTYYYDVAGEGLAMFSDGWDTLGIQKGNGSAGPGLSHMYGAYILEEPDFPPSNLPLPGTLLMFGLGLLGLAHPKVRRLRG